MTKIKTPSYISPSSFSTWNECQWKYYLTRMVHTPVTRDPQSIPGAIGSAFDIYVKRYLADYFDLEFNFKAELDRNLSNPENKEIGIEFGERLFMLYSDTALPYVVEEGVQSVEATIGTGFLFGHPDAILNDGTILDWKTQGFMSSPKSPTQGYTRIWEGGTLKGKPHKKYQEPFETLNEKWSIQTTIYAFILGHTPGDELKIAIDNVTTRNPSTDIKTYNKNTVKISQIRSFVSPEFQVSLMQDLETAWDSISRREIAYPSPSAWHCKSYGRLCEVAAFCEHYQAAFNVGDDDFRALIGM